MIKFCMKHGCGRKALGTGFCIQHQKVYGKVHLVNSQYNRIGSGMDMWVGVSNCGRNIVHVTNNRNWVTCKSCSTKLLGPKGTKEN